MSNRVYLRVCIRLRIYINNLKALLNRRNIGTPFWFGVFAFVPYLEFTMACG